MLDRGPPPPSSEGDGRAASPTTASVSPLLSSSSCRRSSSSPSLPITTSLHGPPPGPLLDPSSPPLRSTSSCPDMAIRPAAAELEARPCHRLSNGCPTWPSLEDAPVTTDCPLAARGEAPTALPNVMELARLLRVDRYQKHRSRHSKDFVHCLQVAAVKTERLLAISHAVRRTLADCIRSEDKHSFVSLFTSFQDACKDRTRLTSSLDSPLAASDVPRRVPPPTVLANLSSSSRAALLSFLARLKYDGAFIANQIASLSQKELLAILPDPGISRATDSVFGHSHRTSSRGVRPLGFVVDRLVDDLVASSARYPLELLVRSVNCTSLPHSGSNANAIDVWATVCARLISEQRPGNEKVLTTLIDMWSANTPWLGKEILQLWLLETLRKGHFLLDQPVRQSFRLRAQAQQEVVADETGRTEAFYADSVAALLDLFGADASLGMIPDGAMSLCRAIFRKLQPHASHQRGFPSFVATKWLFLSFLPNLLVLPESYGMLAGHYISDIARQRIFKEIAARAQRAVYDVVYAWKHSVSVPVDTVKRVNSIIARFQFDGVSASPASESSGAFQTQFADQSFTSMSTGDLLTMVNALYPSRRPASLSSDRDTLRSGLQSSASSVSGFSLFRTADPVAPSFAGFAELESPDTATTAGAEETRGEQRESQTSDRACVDAELMAELRTELEELVNANRLSDAFEWTTFVFSESDKTLSVLQDCLGPGQAMPDPQCIGHFKEMPDWWTAVKTLLETSEGATEPPASSESGPSPDAAAIRVHLLSLFENAVITSEAKCDFVAAHYWLQALQCFERFWQGEGAQVFGTFVRDVQGRLEASLTFSSDTVEICDRFLTEIKPNFHRNADALGLQLNLCRSLRDKMWYAADVRTSAAYESLRGIVNALRVMGKPKRSNQPRMAPPLRHWSASKLVNEGIHIKSEAQILEVLSAIPEHGGPNKLSDDQSRVASLWMDHNHVHLVCTGEERIHKLCMEIRKCAEQLTLPSAAENPMLWSNALYMANDRGLASFETSTRSYLGLTALDKTSHGLESLRMQTSVAYSADALSSASQTLSSVSSRDYFDKSPTLTNKSSATFWSPAITEAHSPSSATSMGSYPTHAAVGNHQRKMATRLSSRHVDEEEQGLRQRIVGLLLSDVALSLYVDGSETDRAFWSGLGGDLLARHVRPERGLSGDVNHMRRASEVANKPASRSRLQMPFDFDAAFVNIFRRFAAACDPYIKLQHLFDAQKLIPAALDQLEPSRLASSKSVQDHARTINGRKPWPGQDVSICGFKRLFCDPGVRPSAIFRDLQYIASLVPAMVLEQSPHGTAFWNAAVALSDLKREEIKIMVETADSIIAYHTNNRGHGRSPSVAQQQRDSATFSVPSRTPAAGDMARYSMADAAYLLQIAAKEGDPAAQRELATLYLTHPELMEHIIAPFTRPRDVFKEELEGKWRKNQDPARCDPVTMCVAHHWMLLSSKGGDALAKEYLRQREEMERLP